VSRTWKNKVASFNDHVTRCVLPWGSPMAPDGVQATSQVWILRVKLLSEGVTEVKIRQLLPDDPTDERHFTPGREHRRARQ